MRPAHWTALAAGLVLLGLFGLRSGLLGPREPMKKLVFRRVGAEGPVMTLYRVGAKYGRLEERDGRNGELLRAIAVSEPDVWQIDPRRKAALHVRDSGTFLNFHAPVVPPEPGSSETLDQYRAKPIASFEFGRELEFMRTNGAVRQGPDAEGLDRYETNLEGATLVVLAKTGTETVGEVQVLKDKRTLLDFKYDSYEPSLPADLSLFRPGPDITVLENGAQSAPKGAGPGEAVPDPKAESAALATLSVFARGESGHPWKMVFCGPELWKRLVALDSRLSTKGTGTAFMAEEGGRAFKVPVRRFLGAGSKIDDKGLYRSAGFKLFAKPFAVGKARSGTREERAALYSVIPFEIKGRPVTVVEATGDSLLFFEGGGLLWLDVLGRQESRGR